MRSLADIRGWRRRSCLRIAGTDPSQALVHICQLVLDVHSFSSCQMHAIEPETDELDNENPGSETCNDQYDLEVHCALFVRPIQ
jgi:hypothetical protein